MVFPAELVRLLDRLEEEIRADRVSSESRAWLAQCGLTVEQLARQVEPEYTPARKVHFLPLRPPGPAAGAHQRRRQIRRGAGSMMNGATSLMKRTRITCTSHTVCRGSSMMRNQGCTITGTGTMTRYRGGILHKTPLGWRGDGTCIITH